MLDKLVKIFFVILTLISLSNCGLKEDYRDVVGQWQATAKLRENGCEFVSASHIDMEHTVSQDKGNVSIIASDKMLFSGGISDKNDGFSAETLTPKAVTVGSLAGCLATEELDYSGINSDGDTTADVTVDMKVSCFNDFVCHTIYEGKARRL